MNCPPAIAEVLLQILHEGLLRIRSSGWQNDVARCAREADHLHNLPSLLSNYSPERLRYYWEAERTGVEPFAAHWARLEQLLPHIDEDGAAKTQDGTSSAATADGARRGS